MDTSPSYSLFAKRAWTHMDALEADLAEAVGLLRGELECDNGDDWYEWTTARDAFLKRMEAHDG